MGAFRLRYAARTAFCVLLAGAAGAAGLEIARLPNAPVPRRMQSKDQPDKTRRDYSADCLASGCHAGLGKRPWVHAPVTVGACDVCHKPQGEAKEHRFKAARPKDQLCSFCHKHPPARKFAHKAFEDAQCLGCHDPHGGASHDLLKTRDAGELCGSCHRLLKPGETPPAEAADLHPLRADYPYVHEPFGKKRCLDCHLAHQSDHQHLLLLPERELCLKCHEEKLRAVEALAFVHEPLKEGCTSCHAGHGGPDHALLRGEPREVCTSCHEQSVRAAEGEKLHGALEDAASCRNCHAGHAAQTKVLLQALPIAELCYRCHAREIKTESGGRIRNVQAEIAAAKYKHGPVAEGDCGACHLSHKSAFADLLKGHYTSEIYEPFSPEPYELCFTCHDPRIVTEERTVLTAFRDGDRNLHFVHVNRRKGRTCRVCHQAHGGERPAFVPKSVPFGPGGWNLPIDFRRTETGGTCATGCHQAFPYDNRNPPGKPGAHLLPAARKGAPAGEVRLPPRTPQSERTGGGRKPKPASPAGKGE